MGFRKKEAVNTGLTNRRQNNNQQRQTRPPVPYCKTYGKKHSGVCNKANIVCYKCNQRGHYSNEFRNQRALLVCNKCGKPGDMERDCRIPAPVNNMLRLAGPPNVTQPKARTFNMHMKEAV